ncbi:MAG: hypothetical protein D3906_03350 [Candidatus Electrothrix sp. AUS1_2]|nr:hypothetical protein [Candidatus Electrothrix sp. AUS1_2]
MKEYRIPFQHIKLGREKYDAVKFCPAFGIWALIGLVSVDEDWQSAEYVFKLGDLKSSSSSTDSGMQRKISDYSKESEKKYIHKCEVLRDGQRVAILNLSTKQGQKQRQQLGRLQGYLFNDLPLEIITT